jgi:hypothetical protein
LMPRPPPFMNFQEFDHAASMGNFAGAAIAAPATAAPTGAGLINIMDNHFAAVMKNRLPHWPPPVRPLLPSAGTATAEPAAAAPATAGAASAGLCRPSVPPSSLPSVRRTPIVTAYTDLLHVLAADLRAAAAAEMLELTDSCVVWDGVQHVLIYIQYRSLMPCEGSWPALCDPSCAWELEEIIAQAASKLSLWPQCTTLVLELPGR